MGKAEKNFILAFIIAFIIVGGLLYAVIHPTQLDNVFGVKSTEEQIKSDLQDLDYDILIDHPLKYKSRIYPLCKKINIHKKYKDMKLARLLMIIKIQYLNISTDEYNGDDTSGDIKTLKAELGALSYYINK